MLRLRHARTMVIMTLVLAMSGAMGGCQSKEISERDLTFVSPGEGIDLVDHSRRLLGIGGETTSAWVDPRTTSEYRAGHIPGAISLPFQNVAADHVQLEAYEIIVVYGNDYNDPKARGMSKRLLELGHDKVYTLRGGLRSWTDSGHQLETDD